PRRGPPGPRCGSWRCQSPCLPPPLPRCERETSTAGEKGDVGRDATTASGDWPEGGALCSDAHNYLSRSGSSITCQRGGEAMDTPEGRSVNRFIPARSGSSGGNPGVSTLGRTIPPSTVHPFAK